MSYWLELEKRKNMSSM